MNGVSKRNQQVLFDDLQCHSEAESIAKQTCVDFVKSMPHARNMLFTGDCGTGKTMTASAMINECAKSFRTGAIRTVTQISRQFAEARDFNSSDSETKALKWLLDLDLLVIDEVGLQKGNQNEMLILDEVINGRYDEMKPTLIISNFSGAQMSELLGDRIVSRLKSDLVQIKFNWESKR